MMTPRVRCLFLSLLLAVCAPVIAAGPGAPRTDPRVEALLKEVRSERIERDIRQLAGFGTRHTLSTTESPTRGIGAAQRWVRDELTRIAGTSGGRLLVDEDAFDVPAGGRFPRAARVTNVVATLPGTDSKRVLVVSAHLDSRATNVLDAASDAPGADDDASGVAAVLELARVMAPQRFRAAVVFLIVSGEEQGLLGSRHWAESARKASRDIEAVLNNDIIGSSRGADGVRDRRRVRVFSEGVPAVETAAAARARALAGTENDSPSRVLARAVADAQRRYLRRFAVTLVFRRDRYSRGGDHVAFNQFDYPAVRLTEMNENWRHQHQNVRVEGDVPFGDLPEFVDFDYVANVARVNLAALADLAWAPPPPSRVRSTAPREETGTILRWDQPTDSDRFGYEILWRSTTAPDWEGVRFVGDVSETAIPLARDSFILAVRAVGREGNRSLPVVAGPAAPVRRAPAEGSTPAGMEN